MTKKRVLFIINKYSGKGFEAKIEGRIIERCDKSNIECSIEYTQKKGHATELAHEAVSAKFPFVFAMGGDGTVNEVAQALVHTTTALGIIPKGSGNGLARHLQIPLRTDLALNVLNKHKIVHMDTMLINEKLSVNVSGIGFDAHVASKFGTTGKRGLMGYAKLVLKEFTSFREFEAHATDGRKIWDKKAFIIALANSSQFGNNARVAPHASVCDGEMEICFIKKVPLTQALGFTAKMFTGKMARSSFVETITTPNFIVEFEKPIACHIDGETYPPVRRVDARIQPASLKVIVPEKVRKKY